MKIILVLVALAFAVEGCQMVRHDDGASTLWRIPQLHDQ